MADEDLDKWCPEHLCYQNVQNDLVDDGVRHLTLECGCTLEMEVMDTDYTQHRSAIGDAVLWNGELFRLDAIVTDHEGTWATIINTGGEEEVLIDTLEYVGLDTLTGAGASKIWTPDSPTPKPSPRHQQTWTPDGGYSWEDPSSSSNYHGSESDSKGTVPQYHGKHATNHDKYAKYNKYRSQPQQKKPKPKPKHGLSTGGFINDEVNRLNDEDKTAKDSTEKKSNVVPIRRGGLFSRNEEPTTKGRTRKLHTSAPTKKTETKDDNNDDPKPSGMIPKRKGDW